jgi:LuxR family transcriptional regulator, maltose regulon positive regulatory protein
MSPASWRLSRRATSLRTDGSTPYAVRGFVTQTRRYGPRLDVRVLKPSERVVLWPRDARSLPVVQASPNTQAGFLAADRPVRDNHKAHSHHRARIPMSSIQVAALLRRHDPASPDQLADNLAELPGEAPAVPAGFVRRPELVDKLTSAPHAVLTLIVAPPGYGKSTLLADWADADDRPFVWLGPAADGTGDPDAVRALLQRGGKRDDGGFVVALDDADLVAPDLLRDLICDVLTELPPGCTLVLTSRTELDLPLARLRTRRDVTELRARDLTMGLGEAFRLLAGAGLYLPPEDVRSLQKRTQGWPAALHLTGLSAAADLEANLGWTEPHGLALSQYLRDEVLSALPEPLMSVARRTAVLIELSPAACDAVLERHGCARDLEELARRVQLLTPIDSGAIAYRWHPLVRQALLDELRFIEPDLEPRLQLRASSWHLDHGNVEPAIEHACEGGDPQRAGDLLWPVIPRLVMSGRGPQVQRWLGHFSDEQIADSAELAASAAHAALAGGDLDGARRWALHAAAAAERCVPRARASSVGAGIAVIDAVSATPGVAEMRVAASRACTTEPGDSLWQPICRSLRGTAAYLASDLDTADELLSQAIAMAGGSVPAITALCLSQRAMIARHREEWELASDHASRAVDVVAAHDLAAEPVSAFVLAAAAATSAHDGRADEAKRDVRASLDLLATLGDAVAWYGAEVRILLACARLWLADVVGARTLLAQASRLGRRTRGAAVFEHWFNMCWSHMDTLAEATLAGPSALTIAELRVLRFLPSHLSFREIAARLGVSANTVKTQAHSVYRKLGAASRSEAVARAQDTGLLGQ